MMLSRVKSLNTDEILSFNLHVFDKIENVPNNEKLHYFKILNSVMHVKMVNNKLAEIKSNVLP